MKIPFVVMDNCDNIIKTWTRKLRKGGYSHMNDDVIMSGTVSQKRSFDAVEGEGSVDMVTKGEKRPKSLVVTELAGDGINQVEGVGVDQAVEYQ